MFPLVILLSLSLFTIGCSDDKENGDNGTTPTETPKGPITVGSKLDAEAMLLGQMIILMLEQNNFEVLDETSFGSTQLVRSAITSGELDIYPEYTGNGAYSFGMTDSDVWSDPQAGYETVKQLDLEQNNIVWLTPAPANNTWAIAIPEALAQQEGLITLADFSAYVNSGGYVKLAASEEFITSPAALPSFQEMYGFVLTGNQLISISDGGTAVTEQAASQNIDGVNAAMAYGTDGALSALGLVILEDPLGAQPVYEPAPIIRAEVLAEYPEIEAILTPVFQGLDSVTLQTLNAKIVVQGQLPQKVATDYLGEKGFLN